MKDGDGSRKSVSVAMEAEETEAGGAVEFETSGGWGERVAIGSLAIGMPKAPIVTIDRAVLEEALLSLDNTAYRTLMHGRPGCSVCGAAPDSQHQSDCRYIRVRDALTKALGR